MDEKIKKPLVGYKVIKEFVSNGHKYSVGETVYATDSNFQLNWANDFLMFKVVDGSGNVAVGPTSAKEYLAGEEIIKDKPTSSATSAMEKEDEISAMHYLYYGAIFAGLSWFTYKYWSSGKWNKIIILLLWIGLGYSSYTKFLKSPK